MSIFERIAEDADVEILLPNRYSSELRMWFVLCPCGRSTGQHDGLLNAHFPPLAQGSMMTAPFGEGSTCRYSGRTITLAAALRRDCELTELERRVKHWSAGAAS